MSIPCPLKASAKSIKIKRSEYANSFKTWENSTKSSNKPFSKKFKTTTLKPWTQSLPESTSHKAETNWPQQTLLSPWIRIQGQLQITV